MRILPDLIRSDYAVTILKDLSNGPLAAQIQPNNAYLFLRRGGLAILQGNYAESIAQFEFALQLYPRMNYAYFDMGRAYLHMERVTDALTAYQHGLSVSDARRDLDDAVEELEKLKIEQPVLAGVDDALTLLQNWHPPAKS